MARYCNVQAVYCSPWMLCVWVHGCDPGRVSDSSRLSLYQTHSIECSSSIFFWHVNFVIVPFLSFLFCFVVFVLLSLELFCRRFSDLSLSSRPRTGLATTYIITWVWLRPDRLMWRKQYFSFKRQLMNTFTLCVYRILYVNVDKLPVDDTW